VRTDARCATGNHTPRFQAVRTNLADFSVRTSRGAGAAIGTAAVNVGFLLILHGILAGRRRTSVGGTANTVDAITGCRAAKASATTRAGRCSAAVEATFALILNIV